MTARWAITCLAGVTAAAVLALAGVTIAAAVVLSNFESRIPDDLSKYPAFAQGPVQAIVDLDASGKDRWRSTLGEDCDLDRIYVFAIASDPDGVDAITVPGDCDFNRIRITPDDGAVRPEDPLSRTPD